MTVSAVDTPEAPSLWRNRNWAMLWSADGLSTLGTVMSMFAMPLVALRVTHSTVQVGAVAAAFAFSTLIARLPGGVLADRVSRRALMLLTSSASAIAFGVLAFTLVIGVCNFALLMACSVVTGAASAIYQPVVMAVIRDIVPSPQIPRAMSRLQAQQAGAHLLGSPLGGFVLALGAAVPFVLDAVSYLAICIAVPFMRYGSHTSAEGHVRDTFLGDARAGLKFIGERAFLKSMLTFACLANFATSGFFLVVILRLAQAGWSPARISLIPLLMGLAALTGSIYAARAAERTRLGHVTVLTGASVVVGFGLCLFLHDPLLIGLALVLPMAMVPILEVVSASYVIAITPAGLQGRVNAAIGFSASLLMPFGPVAGTFIMHVIGADFALGLLLGVMVAALLPLVLVREARQLGTSRSWSKDIADSGAQTEKISS